MIASEHIRQVTSAHIWNASHLRYVFGNRFSKDKARKASNLIDSLLKHFTSKVRWLAYFFRGDVA